ERPHRAGEEGAQTDDPGGVELVGWTSSVGRVWPQVSWVARQRGFAVLRRGWFRGGLGRNGGAGLGGPPRGVGRPQGGGRPPRGGSAGTRPHTGHGPCLPANASAIRSSLPQQRVGSRGMFGSPPDVVAQARGQQGGTGQLFVNLPRQ